MHGAYRYNNLPRMNPSLRFSLLACFALANNAAACAACFGRSDGKQAESMNWGIFSLLVVVVFVLGGIAAFFIYLARRAAMFPAPGDPADFYPTNPKLAQ